jgi:hypothetical protein
MTVHPTARLSPLAPPYSAEIQATFDRIMPTGVPPLALFTTLARDARLWHKFTAASLLDKGHLSLRQREIVIHRTTARCGSEYEWGVHATFFAAAAGLDDTQLGATVHATAEASCWTEAERALLRACDALCTANTLDDATWAGLRAVLTEPACLEFIMLIGFYRTVSQLTETLRLPLEPFARRYPPAAANPN